MSAAVLRPPIVPQPLEIDNPPRKRFTREEFEQILETRAFSDQRFELIDGDMIGKMGQSPPHANSIRRLVGLLVAILGLERVQIQLPIEVAKRDRKRHVPEPDLAVLKENSPDFKTRHPQGNELLLIVEVAETSVSRDTTTKRDLYARAGVPNIGSSISNPAASWSTEPQPRANTHKSPNSGTTNPWLANLIRYRSPNSCPKL